MRILLVFSFFIFIGCSSIPKRVTKKDGIRIINLGERLNLFWSKAKNKNFEEQVKLWDENVEAGYEKIYNNIVWQKELRKDKWKDFKHSKLKIAFQIYKEQEPFYLSRNYIELEKKLLAEISFFKNFFQDAKFNNTFLIAPMGLDLKLAVNYNTDDKDGKQQINLFLASDVIVLAPQNFSYVLLHELFHIYSFNKIGNKLEKYSKEKFDKGLFLTYLLYHEGFALYASDEMLKIRTANIKEDQMSKKDQDFLKAFHKAYPGVNSRLYLQEHCYDLNLPAIFGFKKANCKSLYVQSLKLLQTIVNSYGIERTMQMELPQIRALFDEILHHPSKSFPDVKEVYEIIKITGKKKN